MKAGSQGGVCRSDLPQFQVLSSKCVVSSTLNYYLQFWKVSRTNGNSLYCLGVSLGFFWLIMNGGQCALHWACCYIVSITSGGGTFHFRKRVYLNGIPSSEIEISPHILKLAKVRSFYYHRNKQIEGLNFSSTEQLVSIFLYKHWLWL